MRVTPADEPATVLADPSRCQQMLLNLAVNARDAMPDGATAGPPSPGQPSA